MNILHEPYIVMCAASALIFGVTLLAVSIQDALKRAAAKR